MMDEATAASPAKAPGDPAAAAAAAPLDIVARLRQLADQARPGRGFTMLEDGEVPVGPLCYRELDAGARRVAARLAGLAPGSRALLLHPPGFAFLEAFFGCLYAGLIPVPLPLPPARPTPGPDLLASVAADCRPAIILTAAESRERVDRAIAATEEPALRTVPRIVGDHGLPAPIAAAAIVPPAPDRPAFLQYTSGSTATPKGVTIGHAALSANLDAIARAFRAGPDDVGVIWLPHFHDMGLVGGILETVHLGVSTVLLPPIHVAARPLRWLRAIAGFGGTISGGALFLFERCVTRIDAASRAGLDLGCWRVAFAGAEPLRHAVLARFAETFASCGFRSDALLPCYGLAESTLFVSGGPAGTGCRPADRAPHLADSGLPAAGHEVAIVDPDTRRPVAEGATGEIWVSGPSVATGYWQRPTETGATFGAQTAAGRGPFLRTGDLGHCQEGRLVVTGRLKTLIILAGHNLYAEDVVATLAEAAPQLDPAGIAAFGVAGTGAEGTGEALVVVAEVPGLRAATAAPGGFPGAEAGADVRGLAETIRTALSRTLQVRVQDLVFVPPRRLARTSSGKMRHLACRALYLQGELHP